MTAPAFPEGRFVETNGVRLRVHEAGPRVGTPVVFLHGFPELAFSWRHQLPALAAAGRWAVAPDQRGYGGSDAPEPVEAYDLDQLTGDLVGLLDALGAERAIWCGHDWGGLAAWAMPLRHPERTAGVIALNTPFVPRAPVEPVGALRTLFGEDHYIVFFQRPHEPERVLGADVERTFRFLLRRPESLRTDLKRTLRKRRSLALPRLLAEFDPARDDRPLLSPPELAVFVETFQRTGFRGGVNWYRNLTRNWTRSAALRHRVRRPALMITAGRDPFLPPALATGMKLWVRPLEKRRIPDAGHWTQQEQPEAVNHMVLDWLGRWFPLGGEAERP